MSRATTVDQAVQILDNQSVASKILLIYEDYTEMMSVQSTLQKVGYDVLAISNEYTLGENVVSFNPDVVVGSGNTGKVTTLGVGRRLREMSRWQGKAVLIFPSGYQPSPQDFAKIRADLLLEAPVPSVRMLQVIAKIVGDDEVEMLDRLSKQGGLDAPDDSPVVIDSGAASKNPDLESLWKELTEGAPPPGEAPPKKSVSFDLKEREEEMTEFELAQLADELQRARKTERERVARYAKITAKIDMTDTPQGFKKVRTRQVQKELVKDWNPNEIAQQDHLRREFTKALFKKK